MTNQQKIERDGVGRKNVLIKNIIKKSNILVSPNYNFINNIYINVRNDELYNPSKSYLDECNKLWINYK